VSRSKNMPLTLRYTTRSSCRPGRLIEAVLSDMGSKINIQCHSQIQKQLRNSPNPLVPTPALLLTPTRLVTSGRFPKAWIKVFGVPHSPNPESFERGLISL